MRIRYVLLHAYGTGGTIRTVFTQASSMAAAGHDVEIVSAVRRAPAPRFPLDPRVRVWALVDERPDAPSRAGGADGVGGGPLGRLLRRRAAGLAGQPAVFVPRGEFGFPSFTREVEQALIGYLRGLRDGIVVTTRPGLNLLAARFATAGVVRVAQEHMNLATHREDVRAEIARYYPRCDTVAVLTQRDARDYRALAPGARVVRIPNAVHSLRQRPSAGTGKVAVAAGRFRYQKGFDLLIPAFRQVVDRHPDWRLRIFGSGEKRGELRALIDQHHLYNHVLLMGHSEQLDEELAKASFYVLSSRFEGLPMVMIEAMAHALPVVSFDCPTGPADVLTHGKDGLLVPPKDIGGLADAMCRLITDETLRASLGDAALATVQRYSPDAVHKRWDALFTELLPAARPRPRFTPTGSRPRLAWRRG